MKEIHVISENDLQSVKKVGKRIRSLCPIHQSHDRDLSIAPYSDEYLDEEGEKLAGYGHCHSSKCGATILVQEWNPKAAAYILGRPVKTREPRITFTAPELEKVGTWQLRQLAELNKIYPHARAFLTHARAAAYLADRGLGSSEAMALLMSLEVAYIPPAEEWTKAPPNLLSKWCDRIVFPFTCANGEQGYLGRALRLWHPGMDEEEHKHIIMDYDKRMEEEHGKDAAQYQIRRWRKTYRSGLFNAQAMVEHRHLYICEGPFDTLPLLLAGLPGVIAVAGTHIDVKALPKNVFEVTLAYDGDVQGEKALATTADLLSSVGITPVFCTPPADGQGKDWSERYRLSGAEGLAELLEADKRRCTEPTPTTFTGDDADRCHACQCPFPDFEGWDYELIPPGAQMAYDPTDGNPYCPQCRPDLFEEAPYEPTMPSPKVEPTHGSLTTPEQVLELAEQLKDGAYVLDLETTGLNSRRNKIITIALGTAEQVWTIDVRSFYIANEATKARWVEALQTLLHRDCITWAGHNLKFDLSFLAVQFDVRLCKVYDTMLVEQLLHNQKHTGKGFFRLDSVASRYGLVVSKQERNWFIDLDQRPIEWQAPLPSARLTYIEQDIRVPYQIRELQQEKVNSLGLSRVVEIEHAVLPALAAMEVKGIAVDVDEWRAIIVRKSERRGELEPVIKRVLGEALASQGVRQQCDLWGEYSLPTVDLSSTSQLKAALQALGITVESTESDVLKKVKDTHEVIPMLLEWKGAQKFITSFGESVLQHVDDTGRIHATFRQLGAVSGRITCTDPGLQTIPKPEEGANLRKCFIAPPGTKMLVADLSNIELRIIADFSKDPTMLRFFDEGKDLHAETARIMFHLGPDADTKKTMIHGKKARDIAKTINFGIAYGQKAGGLAESLGISRQEAQEALEVYTNTYSVLAQYLDVTSKKSVSQGYTTTPSGRRRDFTELELSRDLRYSAVNASKNHPIQGTGADILKRAMTLLYARLPQSVSIIHAVHDELLIEAPLDQVDIASELLGTCMLEACKEFLPNVAFPPIEVSVADYWVKD